MATTLLTRDAVNAIAENLYASLPKYVSAQNSILMGIAVTAVVCAVGVYIAERDAREHKENTDILLQTRWVVVLLVFGYLGLQLGEITRDRHYTYACLKQNHQHFANTHWLKLYMKAAQA